MLGTVSGIAKYIKKYGTVSQKYRSVYTKT